MNYSRLIDLYNQLSKHSHYQILANPLKTLISHNLTDIHSRYEKERLDFILKHLQSENVLLADIGGNTGYFTLEFVQHGAKTAFFFDGNKAHSDFMQEAVTVLGWQDRIEVNPYYINFDQDLSLNVDIALLLNVLHHVGDDYGEDTKSIELAKKSILDSLALLSRNTKFLVFQLGFNWKGNRELPLFKSGTKKELIDFIDFGTRDSWAIHHIGIAENVQSGIVYSEVNSQNIVRQDSLGEFLNRPIFIMKSRFIE